MQIYLTSVAEKFENLFRVEFAMQWLMNGQAA